MNLYLLYITNYHDPKTSLSSHSICKHVCCFLQQKNNVTSQVYIHDFYSKVEEYFNYNTQLTIEASLTTIHYIKK